MKRTIPIAVAALALLAASPALASLDAGQQKFLQGDYKGARALLAKVRGKEQPTARALMARIDLQTGAYDSARKLAEKLRADRRADVAEQGHVLVAEVDRLHGRFKEARRHLEPLVAKNPKALRARYLLALTYRDLGQGKRADTLFDTFFTDFNAGRIDENNGEYLFYVAEAARYLSAFEDANATYQEAVRLAPKLLDANLQYGFFGLEKYAVSIAEQSFDEVLAIDPNHPDAHVGVALVKLEQTYDLAAAHHHLKKALEQNTRHVPALLTRASLEIDQNRWDAAKATLAEVFAVDQVSYRGRAMLATVHWLRDDMKAYHQERKRVFGKNPEFAEFFHIVARSAVREHRYKEAIALEQQAVKVDPEYYTAMSEVGSGYLRLGQEKEGLEWLQKAWKGDQYNARTFNMLNLFEDELPKQYSFVNSKSFKLRFPNEEKEMLHRYVTPVLERAFSQMVKRYGFTPKKPVIIEFYKDPGQYGVRTVGLPNLGALGVCFGQVITTMSPSVGELNWGMVVWHELAHVFAIQISKSRVPRWYTEGLSEYETLIIRPEWRREHDAQVWAAMDSGTLPSVATLNYEFMKPSMQKVVVAYYLSSLTIEYIASHHGFDKIVEGLRLFGEGKETPEVVERITGQKIPDFDKAFQKYLRARLAPYKGTFNVPTEGFDDITKLQIAVDARPKDAGAHAALALGHFFEAKARDAMKAAEAALALDAKNRIALYVKGEIQLKMRATNEAEKTFHALIAAGGDNFEVRGRLAMLARSRNDMDEAIKQLCAAKKLDPERPYPYQELAEIYKSQNKQAEALAEMETYVMLEQMQFGPLKDLLKGHADLGNWHKVRHFGEMALNISLTDPELFLLLGRAYLETGAHKEALFTYDSALMVRPRIRRPALAHMGRAQAYWGMKQKRQARKALGEALRVEPENAKALQLKEKFK